MFRAIGRVLKFDLCRTAPERHHADRRRFLAQRGHAFPYKLLRVCPGFVAGGEAGLE